MINRELYFGVTLRVMVIMGVVELGIMFFIEFVLPRDIRHLGVFIDPLLLVVLGAPLVAWWVVKPYERARARAVADANFIAMHDPLTRLPNRRMFSQFLEHAVAGARRRHHYGAILVLDLDRFREINETFGHEAGDTVLQAVGTHIAGELRGEDFLCRVGGDEFAVALVDLSSERAAAERMAREVADKVRFALRRPVPFDDSLLQVDASVGVRLFGGDAVTAEMALREAGAAVVQAKAAGRGQVILASDAGAFALATRQTMFAEIERDHLEIDALVDELILTPTHRLAALQQLADKTLAHLRFEDEVAARVLGDAAAPHRTAHAALAERIGAAVAAATESSAPRVGMDIHAWVQAHIHEYDEKLVFDGPEGLAVGAR